MPQPPGTMPATASVFATEQIMQAIFRTAFSKTNWLPVAQEVLTNINQSIPPLGVAAVVEMFDLKKRASNLCTTSANLPAPQTMVDTRYRYRHNSANTPFAEEIPLQTMEERRAGVSKRFTSNSDAI